MQLRHPVHRRLVPPNCDLLRVLTYTHVIRSDTHCTSLTNRSEQRLSGHKNSERNRIISGKPFEPHVRQYWTQNHGVPQLLVVKLWAFPCPFHIDVLPDTFIGVLGINFACLDARSVESSCTVRRVQSLQYDNAPRRHKCCHLRPSLFRSDVALTSARQSCAGRFKNMCCGRGTSSTRTANNPSVLDHRWTLCALFCQCFLLGKVPCNVCGLRFVCCARTWTKCQP